MNKLLRTKDLRTTRQQSSPILSALFIAGLYSHTINKKTGVSVQSSSGVEKIVGLTKNLEGGAYDNRHHVIRRCAISFFMTHRLKHMLSIIGRPQVLQSSIGRFLVCKAREGDFDRTHHTLDALTKLTRVLRLNGPPNSEVAYQRSSRAQHLPFLFRTRRSNSRRSRYNTNAIQVTALIMLGG